MYSFQKEYDLKAHSPLIHFQSDSSGATLRATEVKPKLDRYILKHCKDIPKEWIRDNVNGKSFAEYNKKYEPRIRLRYSLLNIKRNGNMVNFPIFLCDWLNDVLPSL